MSVSKFTADSTLLYLLVACGFITIWLVGAGWIEVDRIQKLTNLVIGLGIGTGMFSLAKSFKDVSRQADDKAETVRTEVRNYYRALMADLVTSGKVAPEVLTELETKQHLKQNGDTDT